MSSADNAHEPSMDEIIRSIRNIIADDQAADEPVDKKPVVQLSEAQVADAAAPAEPVGEAPVIGVPAEAASNEPAPVADSLPVEATAAPVPPNKDESSDDLLQAAPIPLSEAAVVAPATETVVENEAPPAPKPEAKIPPAPSLPVTENAADASEDDPVAKMLSDVEDVTGEAEEIKPAASDEAVAAFSEASVAAVKEADPIAEAADVTVSEKTADEAPEPAAKVEAVADEPAEKPADKKDDGDVSTSSQDTAALAAVANATSEALSAGGEDTSAAVSGSKTLEDSVREMLKPMIREWLDDNMPRILEGAIKEEIKSND